jgi:hypothetical protein
MRRPAGSAWRAATDEFGEYVSAEGRARYGASLDLLTEKVGPHLWDCDGGIWEPPGTDAARKSLSLAWLGRLLVEACEGARGTPAPEAVNIPARLPAARRRKIAGDMRSVAAALQQGGYEIAMAVLAARKHVAPSAESQMPPPPDLKHRTEMQAWVSGERRLSADRLAEALLAAAGELDGKDYRTRPRGRREGPETTLATEVVTWLRVATGAPWDYQRGGGIPTGGRPSYDVAAAFLEAAGWPSMTADVIKSRLDAKGRA